MPDSSYLGDGGTVVSSADVERVGDLATDALREYMELALAERINPNFAAAVLAVVLRKSVALNMDVEPWERLCVELDGKMERKAVHPAYGPGFQPH